jgi:hypothetical protein
MLLAGILLLALSLLGDGTAAGRYQNFPPRPWERFDPALSAATPDMRSLYRAAETRAGGPLRDLPAAKRMEVLFGVVSDRFTHGNRATYSPYSNWILWTLGLVVPRYRDIQDPDVLLKYGHSLLCGDVSFVLMGLAAMSGIPARHVLLNGHILMEAWYDGDWHAYDPDLEVWIRGQNGRVLSVREAIGRVPLITEAYAGKGDARFLKSVLEIFADPSDDRYLTYPPRGLFGGSGQRPGRLEQAAGYGRYGIPAAFLAAGSLLLLAGWKKGRRG